MFWWVPCESCPNGYDEAPQAGNKQANNSALASVANKRGIPCLILVALRYLEISNIEAITSSGDGNEAFDISRWPHVDN